MFIRLLAPCRCLGGGAVLLMFLAACSSDPAGPGDGNTPPLPASPQIRMQVAFDQTEVAIRMSWISQPKVLPAGQANVGQIYPMQFHDMLQWSGTMFDRLASDRRLDEDRVSLIFGMPNTPGRFENAGCYISCHSGMASHNLGSVGTLDHWHWRGGRSGPMGYAEDAAIDATARIRDAQGTAPSVWLRSGGDRQREDQGALSGTGSAEFDGLPRFVFNKGKMMPDNVVIPAYFLATPAGVVVTNPYTELPGIRDVSVNRSLLVAFQDRTFDPVDKVNALDVGYLVHVALGTTAHLPSHLRTTTNSPYLAWTLFWSNETGINLGDITAAEAKLAAILQEWEASSRQAMVTRSIGFIYPSDQHDITTTRNFDATTNTWTVTLFRKLSTGSSLDVDLSGLAAGTSYSVAFAMHDAGGGSETHDTSLPYLIGSGPGVDVPARLVADVRSVDWGNIPALNTRYVKRDKLKTWDWLTNPAEHGGSGFVGAIRCQSCHGVDEVSITQ